MSYSSIEWLRILKSVQESYSIETRRHTRPFGLLLFPLSCSATLSSAIHEHHAGRFVVFENPEILVFPDVVGISTAVRTVTVFVSCTLTS